MVVLIRLNGRHRCGERRGNSVSNWAAEIATILSFWEVRPLVSGVRLSSVFLTLVLCVCFAQAFGEELSIKPYTAEYRISAGILRGTLVTTVVEGENGFDAMSVIKAKGGLGKFARNSITEHAQFTVENGQIRPVRFSSVDGLSNRPKELDFLFDREAGIVSGTVNDTHYEYPLDDDLYDRVTILYSLISDIQNGRNETDYRLMDGKKIKALTIQHLPSNRVTTPYGQFDVVGIEHDDVRKERRTVMWFAAELDYMPVVIEQYRKGKLLARALLHTLGKPPSGNDPVSAAER